MREAGERDANKNDRNRKETEGRKGMRENTLRWESERGGK